jgi:hypothetical protein
MKIDLRIDRLVLDAALLGGGRADAVAAAIESELARRLALPGAADALRRIGRIDALPALVLVADTDAQRWNPGKAIAGSLGDGLGLAAPGAQTMDRHEPPHRTDDAGSTA